MRPHNYCASFKATKHTQEKGGGFGGNTVPAKAKKKKNERKKKMSESTHLATKQRGRLNERGAAYVWPRSRITSWEAIIRVSGVAKRVVIFLRHSCSQIATDHVGRYWKTKTE